MKARRAARRLPSRQTARCVVVGCCLLSSVVASQAVAEESESAGGSLPNEQETGEFISGGAQVRFRSQFSLSTDDDHLAKALDATASRLERGDSRWFGVPLDDSETDHFSAWTAFDRDVMPKVIDALSDLDKSLAFVRLLPDVAKISLQVAMADASQAGLVLERLGNLGLTDVSVSFRVVDHSAADLRTAREELARQFSAVDAHAGSTTLVSQARAEGLDPYGYDWSPWEQRLHLLVEPTTIAEARRSMVVGLVAGIEVDVVPRAPFRSASNRNSKTGQLSSGLAIYIGGGCTANVSVVIGGLTYLVTAGHCLDGNKDGVYDPPGTPVSHDGQVIAYTTSYYWNRNRPGYYGTYDVALLSLAEKNDASQYNMAVLSSTYAVLEPVTSIAHTISYPAPVGIVPSFVCYEGASPARGEISADPTPITLCGNVLGFSGDSFVRVDVPVCLGDSGGIVRNGGTAYGIVVGQGDGFSTNCGSTMFYADLATNLAAFGSYSLVTDSYTRLKNYNSARCVSTNGAEGSTLVQRTCSTALTAQRWRLIPVTTGTADRYQIQQVTTGSCMDPYAGLIAVNTQVLLWYCNTEPNQKWDLVRVAAGRFQIRNSKSSNACARPYNGSTSDGASIRIDTCSVAPSRSWLST